jgi:hypothetical protein
MTKIALNSIKNAGVHSMPDGPASIGLNTKLNEIIKLEKPDSNGKPSYNIKTDIHKLLYNTDTGKENDQTYKDVIEYCIINPDPSKFNECISKIENSNFTGDIISRIKDLDMRTLLALASKFDISYTTVYDSLGNDKRIYQDYEKWYSGHPIPVLSGDDAINAVKVNARKNIIDFIKAIITTLNEKSNDVNKVYDEIFKRKREKTDQRGLYNLKYSNVHALESKFPTQYSLTGLPGQGVTLYPIRLNMVTAPIISGGSVFGNTCGSELFRNAYKSIITQLNGNNKKLNKKDNERILEAIDKLGKLEDTIAEIITNFNKYGQAPEGRSNSVNYIGYNDILEKIKQVPVIISNSDKITTGLVAVLEKLINALKTPTAN